MKNSANILGGVVGAVLGFAGALLLYALAGVGNRADPIASGLAALFLVGPLGAVAGTVLGNIAVMRLRRRADSGGLAGNSLKSLAVVFALVVGAGGAYYAYAVSTATSWLNPNAANPLLQFEVRLPAGAAPVQPREIAVELQTDLNTMPGELKPLRADDGRPVVAGEVELAFRTANRQLRLRVADQPERLYPIGLTAKAPHSDAFGPWQALPDGSAIRYRAKWPGRD